MAFLGFIFLVVLYVGLNFFIWKGTVHWLSTLSSFLHNKWFRVLFSCLYILLATTPVSWLLVRNQPEIKAIVMHINNIWIGIFIYTLFFIAIAFLVTAVVRLTGKLKKGEKNWNRFVIIRGGIIAALIIGFSIYGYLHVGKIQTSNYNVHVEKDYNGERQLKVVLVADMHMGYSIGKTQIHHMVERINAQNPDLVCIAGDIFDNDFNAISETDEISKEYRRIKSKYGVYACYGNHDISENLVGGFTVPGSKIYSSEDSMENFLGKSNIKLLKDEAVQIDDGFYLIGRLDCKRPGTSDGTRKAIKELTANLDQRKPIIMMDHEPYELQEAADAGVDLNLSGHTHDGQIFPGNLLMPFLWENPYGYLKKDNMHSIVTSGIGVWGPAMRVATTGEIAVINVKFNPSYQTQR